MTGCILRIERASIHDGPGLRTVVFLKGCPLRCRWCSTPESWSAEPQTAGDTVYGRAMTVEAVLAQVLKDEVFYLHSGGGVTLSGGEPLAQPQFTAALLAACRASGVHTALETALHAPFEALAEALPLVEHLFVDIKHTDPAAHRALTGLPNDRILENLRRLPEAGFRGTLVLRTPLIPSLNDSPENLAATGRLAAELPQRPQVELLPYHRLGLETYRRLGLSYPLSHITPPSPQAMEAARQAVQAGRDACKP